MSGIQIQKRYKPLRVKANHQTKNKFGTREFDKYEDYWAFLPEEINMVESNENTGASMNFGTRSN
jgi:hypothetical protein